MRRFALPLVVLGLSLVLMGARPASHDALRTAPPLFAESTASQQTSPAPPDASSSYNTLLTVSGVLTGDAVTPSPAPTATPVESVAGETAVPSTNATPPPTTSSGDLLGSSGSSLTLVLLLGVLSVFIGLALAQYQRQIIRRDRSVRRRTRRAHVD